MANRDQRIECSLAGSRRGNPGWLLDGGTFCPVDLRSGRTQTEARRQQKEVLAEVARAKGVQEGVGAGVDWVKEEIGRAHV